MLNYMRGEGYKVLRRKYPYIFLVVMLALETALALMIALPDFGNNNVTFGSSIGILGMLLAIGPYLTLMVSDMVCSEQYKYNTLKNEVSFGLSRSRIYLGKLGVQVILGLALCVILLGYYIGLCYVLMPHGPADGEMFRDVLQMVLQSLPLWLGSLGLSHLMLMLCNSSTAGSFAMVGILAILPQGFHLLSAFVHEGFRVVYSLMLTTHLGDIFTLPAFDTPWAILAIGLGWLAVTTLLGLFLFRKKEIR